MTLDCSNISKWGQGEWTQFLHPEQETEKVATVKIDQKSASNPGPSRKAKRGGTEPIRIQNGADALVQNYLFHGWFNSIPGCWRAEFADFVGLNTPIEKRTFFKNPPHKITRLVLYRKESDLARECILFVTKDKQEPLVLCREKNVWVVKKGISFVQSGEDCITSDDEQDQPLIDEQGKPNTELIDQLFQLTLDEMREGQKKMLSQLISLNSEEHLLKPLLGIVAEYAPLFRTPEEVNEIRNLRRILFVFFREYGKQKDNVFFDYLCGIYRCQQVSGVITQYLVE
jgi:hypothetical protein